jgi:hypothetical protein
MDHRDDLPVGLRRRRAAHARAARADGRAASRRPKQLLRESGRHPRGRSRGERHAARRGVSRGAVRRAARGEPDSRGSTRIWATGQSREEWKAGAEANKIMGTEAHPVPVEGICVRVGAMRCHSQALTIKLKRGCAARADRAADRRAKPVGQGGAERARGFDRELSPAAVSGSLHIPIGRLRKLAMGGHYLSAFTVGDQLLWGAAARCRAVFADGAVGGEFARCARY